MRVGFAGTPEFAARALAEIHRRGYTIPLVLTQPDRPSGRGLAPKASAVKRLASNAGIRVEEPPSLGDESAKRMLAAAELDVLAVVAYGLLLPRAVLDVPRNGCLNIHASLLPRWRGAAPIARAIEAGDDATGVTIMRMDAGLDTGPIVAARPIAIGARETAGSLHDRLADLGAAMIIETLDALARDGRLPSSPQPMKGVTYAAKIGRADARVDWHRDPTALDRMIRALSPMPGAVARFAGGDVKIRAAVPLDAATGNSPGTVVAVGAHGVDVACGTAASSGVLRVTHLQRAGGRAMAAHAFAVGHGVAPGTRFENGC